MRTRAFALTVWVSLVAGHLIWLRSRDLTVVEAAEDLRAAMADHWWGPVLFVVAYALRPLVLFPAAVLTVLGGLAFGLVAGVWWTLLASGLSTVVTYAVGRFFGSEGTADRLGSLLGGRIGRAVDRPFETTLLMRLVYVPFDAVGYVAGFLRLRPVPFLTGSLLGTVPGIVAFVGFGASVRSLDEGTPSVDWRIAAASLVLAVGGIVVARRLREPRPTPRVPELVGECA